MPNVRFYATSKWLPMDGKSSSPLHHFTHDLLDVLPRAVAGALQQIAQQEVKEQHVAVMPLPLHPWAQNCAEIEIDIEPDPFPASSRFEVVEYVKNSLLRYFGSLHDQYELAVYCGPRATSGLMVMGNDKVVFSWGVPKP